MQLPPLPEGYAPGQTRIPVIWGITLSFCMAATILAALRLYVRLKLLHSVGKDDWFLLAALALSWAFGSLTLWGCSLGFGRHMYDIVKEGADPSNFYYLGLLSPLLYNLAQLLIQLSILTFYLRLSFSQRLIYMAYGLMVFASLNAAASITANLIFFLVNIGDNSWKNYKLIYYLNSSVNLAIDFGIWSLPLSSLWRLRQLDFRKRLALVATFSVGLFCCLSGVVRSVYIPGASKNRGDETWDKVPIQLLCTMETTLAISSASMAILKPLLAQWGWIGGTPVASRYIGGDDAHAAGGHGRQADIGLGKLSQSTRDEEYGQDLTISNSRKSIRLSNAFGTIQTRHERIDEHGPSESTASLAGAETATGSIAPGHHYHYEIETGHGHGLSTPATGAVSSVSISSTLNTESQFTPQAF